MNVWSHFVVEGNALGFLALVFVQIAVVVAVAWALARGRSPVLRSKVWVGALIACLVGPPLIGAFELSNTRLIALRILPSPMDRALVALLPLEVVMAVVGNRPIG